MSGYVTVMGVFVWPIIFVAIIGYVYLKQQSLTAAAIAALIIFAVFGNALVGVDILVNFLYIALSLIVTGVVLLFIIRRVRR
jgi:uncharacterized sodium:solute symporter family permease YidK